MRSTSLAPTILALALLAGPATAQPAAQPLTILDVPYLSQSEALCGGAAAAMILRYWGERGLSADSFAHLVDRSAAGIRTDTLVGDLRDRGWNATGIRGSDGAIAAELSRGRPVLALIEDRPGTFHYIVIVAATPRAVVFHDPARAPMRVMGVDEFSRVWEPAGRWMAVIVPGVRSAVPLEPVAASPPSTPCEELIATGVAHAQASDLTAAERSLTAALSCPGAAAARELAGVRLLQRRWPDVESLSATAVAIDPQDAHAWRLLGTSRFVQNDAPGALAAWNQVGEPRIDLVRVEGLVRTRQRVVERLIGVDATELLSASTLALARRRLQLLPSARSTRLDYVPVQGGLAELRAIVNERPRAPSGWSFAGIAGAAAARREAEISFGALTGGGERVIAAWRFWEGRPAVRVTADSPAPWGGTWGTDAVWQQQPFDDPSFPEAERLTVQLATGNWLTPAVRLSAHGGVDQWRGGHTYARAGGTVEIRSRSDRVGTRLTSDLWMGGEPFAAVDAGAVFRSRTARAGSVYVLRGGAGWISPHAPPDAWFAADTGDTRTPLLRAHPVIEDGRLATARLARQLVHASVEAQRWWPVSILRVAAAAFADAARADRRLTAGGRTDGDVGVGGRLAVPGMEGTFRLDIARGLRDGATTMSFVYEPFGW